MLRLHPIIGGLLSLAVIVLSDGVITDMKVKIKIQQRYAQTTVIATMKNPNPDPRELKFKMSIPKTAFISSLIMEIEGVQYESTVKEKSAAKKTYDSARRRGKTTGLVEQRDTTEKKFEVSANVAAERKVIFYLRYEELLQRIEGKYHYSIDVQPGHVVPKYEIDLHIIEKENITSFEPLVSHEDSTGYVDDRKPNEVRNVYKLDESSIDGGIGKGVQVQYSFTYEVDTQPDGGEVQVLGNYFVHHFTPEGLPIMAVHTIFVLDISQSMSDGKLEQMKEAMQTILKDLRRQDTFELIAFASIIEHLGTFSGRKKELQRALNKVKRLHVTGSTNLYDAYLEAVKKMTEFDKPNFAKQIVFLTDGVATTGVTDKIRIRRDVREANSKQHPIFGLAFGKNADAELLKRVSADNKGFSRKIAFNENTQDQLKGFYEEISSPLLADVDIQYPENTVLLNTTVKQGTAHSYTGGEIVVAGQVLDGVIELRPLVVGIGKEGPVQFRVERLHYDPSDFTSEKDNFVARLWAYLTVQDMLEKASISENQVEIENLKKEALDIALRFNFVTKLTSLVVVRPEDDDDDTEDLIAERDAKDPQGNRRKSQDSHSTSNQHQPQASSSTRPPRPQSSQSDSMVHQQHRQSRRQFVDNDPHFVVSAPGMPLPFCFDLHAQHGSVLSLVKDSDSGITVNGEVTSAIGRPHLTYFTRLFMAFDQLTVIITPDTILLQCPQDENVVTSLWPLYNKNGKRRKHPSRSQNRRKPINEAEANRTKRSTGICNQHISWKQASGKMIAKVMLLLPKKKKLQLHFGDGDAHFVVLRSKNKYGQPFLGFYVQQERIFSSNTTGIIGQFAAKNVTIGSIMAENSTDISINRNKDTTPVNISYVHENSKRQYETSEVSGYLSHRRSLLDKVQVRCLHVRNSGQGLLDGHPNDYILPCLSC